MLTDVEHIKHLEGAIIKDIRWNLPDQNAIFIETDKGNFMITSVVNKENKDYLSVSPYIGRQISKGW